MKRDNNKNSDKKLDCALKSFICGINGERLYTKSTQKEKKADAIEYALEGRLKHGEIIEYGYQIGDRRQIPLNWSYIEIDGKKYFVYKDDVGLIQYSEHGDSNWVKSDLKKALDENKFKLYAGSKIPLGKDERIDGGVTILSKEQYKKVEKDLPLPNYTSWLRETFCGFSLTVDCVNTDGSIYDYYVHGLKGVRPAFCLKP